MNYPYNSTAKLSSHFSISEFRCKCGKKHDTILSTELTVKLELLYAALNCSKIIVNSGYRCANHDKAVGGNGYGQHTKGTAADIKCYDKSGKIINTKMVACRAQDIGFRGIGNIDKSYTAIHVDVRGGGKWYGDEAVKGGTANSVTNDYYTYYGISGPDTTQSTSQDVVKALQTALNASGGKLTVDGIVGSKTLAECRKHSVAKNAKGELVKWVQNRLNSLSFNCGVVDGIAGEKTMQAIYTWQRQNGLGIGYLGGGDWDKLVKG